MMRRRSSSTTLSRSGRWAAPMLASLTTAVPSRDPEFCIQYPKDAPQDPGASVSLNRKPLYAPHGVVATSQPLAASAGLAVLRRGGNAVDAAIATAVTLTVVQPGSNDIGGDLFALVWDGSALHGLNASGRSPAALTRDRVGAGEP